MDDDSDDLGLKENHGEEVLDELQRSGRKVVRVHARYWDGGSFEAIGIVPAALKASNHGLDNAIDSDSRLVNALKETFYQHSRMTGTRRWRHATQRL